VCTRLRSFAVAAAIVLDTPNSRAAVAPTAVNGRMVGSVKV
jgi:hypothetical protein